MDHDRHLAGEIRILLLADTHIGYDLPVRPRVQRRRRGHDFLANFERALAPALAGDVDLVVHGGDLLDRSRPAPAIVEAAIAPLARVADAGVPVVVVPGNHERGRIPRVLACARPGLHVLERPMTLRLAVGGRTVALSGFPFQRGVARRIDGLLAEAGGLAAPADVRLLCLHQTFEGAVVGPNGYTFRRGAEVVPGRAIPAGFAAVLSGHIHRRQTLCVDLDGRRLAAPVLYPGSVERTSYAERAEEKSYAIATVLGDRATGGRLVSVEHRPLPARPMVTLEIDLAAVTPEGLAVGLRTELGRLQPDAVVRLVVTGSDASATAAVLAADRLRALAPPTMNVDVRWPRKSATLARSDRP